jgi:hypothetical protein
MRTRPATPMPHSGRGPPLFCKLVEVPLRRRGAPEGFGSRVELGLEGPAGEGSVLDRYQVVGLADAASGLADGAQHKERMGVAMLAFAAHRANVQSRRGPFAAGRCRALDRRGIAHAAYNAWCTRFWRLADQGIDFARDLVCQRCAMASVVPPGALGGGAGRARRSLHRPVLCLRADRPQRWLADGPASLPGRPCQPLPLCGNRALSHTPERQPDPELA